MKIVVILLVIVALVLCHMGHHMGDHMGHGCHRSSTITSFLKNVSSEARKQYTAILKNNETIAQQNEEILNWAKQYGVKEGNWKPVATEVVDREWPPFHYDITQEGNLACVGKVRPEQLDEYNDSMVRLKQELRRNFTSLVSDLPLTLADFFKITEKEDQTQAEKKAALGELKKRNPKAFNVLRFTFAQLKPHQHCPHKGKSRGAHGMSEDMPPKMKSREEMKDVMTRMVSHMMTHMMSHMMEHGHMDGSHDSKDHRKKEPEEQFEHLEPFYVPEGKVDSDIPEDTNDS